MSVIRTDNWLLDSYEKPIELCEKLRGHFNGANASLIYDHLTLHGMYRRPDKNGNELIKNLQRNKIWEIIQLEKQLLETAWGGPSIPIFIFPSDPYDQKILRNFNGKSGLAYIDKLFLFISEENERKEIRALFTHEYNHVCRLSKYRKKEEDYVLLDTIILEGLAESAVKNRVGEKFMATWTSYYSNEKLVHLWNTLVLPNKGIRITDRKHHDLLYGLRSYPKMLGYCVGYYLVQSYIKENNVMVKDLLDRKTETIAQI